MKNCKYILLAVSVLMSFVVNNAYAELLNDENNEKSISVFNTLGEKSGYSLKQSNVETNTCITNYILEESGLLTPVYYSLTIGNGKNEYSYATDRDLGANTKLKLYWDKDSDNNYFLTKTKVEGADYLTIYYGYRRTDEVILEVDNKLYTRDLIGKKVSDKYGASLYGAFVNYAHGTKIGGNFVNNTVTNSGAHAYGAAVTNTAPSKGYDASNPQSILILEGNFINNMVTSGQEASLYQAYISGGAIFNNKGIIEKLDGNFIGNSAVAVEAYANGGAIFNFDSTESLLTGIRNIYGIFIGNHAIAKGEGENGDGLFHAFGGAIVNEKSNIGSIEADFIGNYVDAQYARGGAIDTWGDVNWKKVKLYSYITDIKGDFIGNYVNAKSLGYGGAINNYGLSEISTINGIFTGNHVFSLGDAFGGAINNYSVENTDLNRAKIGAIVSDFTNNYAEGLNAYGGAIYNDGTIETIKGSFIHNKAISSGGTAQGGAIWTNSSLNFVADDGEKYVFANNYTVNNGKTDNNAIYAANSNVNLAFEITNGSNILFKDNINGEVGYNITIKGDSDSSIDFYDALTNADLSVNNVTVNLHYNNGAINIYNMNSVSITDSSVNLGIDVDFTNAIIDQIVAKGDISTGTILIDSINYISSNTSLKPVTFKVLDLKEGSSLKLILDDSINSNLTTVPIDNVVTSENVITVENAKISSTVNSNEIISDKYYSSTTTADRYYTDKISVNETGDSLIFGEYTYANENTLKTLVGLTVYDTLALLNETDFGNTEKIFNFNDTDNNTYIAKSDLGISTGILSINGIYDADGNKSTLYLTEKKGFELSKNDTILNINDVNVKSNNAVIKVSGNNNEVNLKNVEIDNNIEASVTYKLGIEGDITINGTVGNANVVTNDYTVLNINNENTFKNANVTFNTGLINLANDIIQNVRMQSLNITNSIDMWIDADLANFAMDRLPANTIVSNNAFINIDKINLLSDSVSNYTSIPFAYASFKDSIKYKGNDELSTETQITTAYAPIYKYNVNYDKNTGNFIFTRGIGSSSESYNPAVLSAPVSAQSGAYSTVNQTFSYAFQNSENFMSIPYAERIAMKNANKYANVQSDSIADAVVFSPLFTENSGNGFWVKPYSVFENVPIKNGPKVSSVSYGTLIGVDSELESIKNGYDRVWTAYIGYNGASQHYSGVNSTQNGGLIGGTLSLYKGNFFNATTLNIGSSLVSSSTMYGNDESTLLLAGIANKTGYNIELFNGHLILQPSMLISYSFINTFDYTNAAGVRIDSDPLNTIQLSPGLKVIGHTKNHWQPYIGVNMVWDIMNETNVKANGVKLPEMSIKPYVQYGVGVQKKFKNDSMMTFGQAMIQNGGRNGISLTFGLRWFLGKVSGKYEPKKPNSTGEKKYIKI